MNLTDTAVLVILAVAVIALVWGIAKHWPNVPLYLWVAGVAVLIAMAGVAGVI